MDVKVLSLPEATSKGYTHIVTLDYTDFNDTAGLTKTVAILPNTLITPGKRVNVVSYRLETAFAGTATATLKVGDDGDDDRFVTAAVANLKATANRYAILPTVATQPHIYNAANTVDAIATATTDNLDQLSAGKIHLHINVVDETTSS